MSVKSEPKTRREMTRVRPLSTLGQEQYESAVHQHLRKIREVKTDIGRCIDDIRSLELKPTNISNAIALQRTLEACYDAYRECSEDFLSFLHATRTVESLNEAAAQRLILDSIDAKVEAAHLRLNEFTLVAKKEGSLHKSVRSSTSNRSSLSSGRSSSSYLRKVEAKLNASRARLKFVEREVEILQEKAALDAFLKLEKAKCEIEIQERKAEIMRESFDTESRDSEILQTRRMRTEEYVNKLYIKSNDRPHAEALPEESMKFNEPIPVLKTPRVNNMKATRLDPDAPAFAPKRPPYHEAHLITSSPIVSQKPNDQYTDFDVQQQPNESSNQMTEFTKFLVKKDLLMSRLNQYDDNPMLYVAWKLNFKGIMKELATTASEELDLLCRWLGPASARQANSIRACNADNPALAVKKIWERLEQRFGSPEIVEQILKDRITSFPKITASESKRLFDLADLVSEIASVKEQPQYSVLFGYFDSSTGINPIVSKLPWNLQEKWVAEASRFKRQQGNNYPPFSMFVKFIQETAQTRNDPSFQFDRTEKNSNSTPSKRTSAVVVKKTVTTDSMTNQSESTLCPLHGTKHSLNECSAFRKRSLVERKKFILTNGICFKCCGPRKHRAANCKENVKCDICKGSSHPSALHVDMDPHVGEPSAAGTVRSACTQIDGNPCGTCRSCAKIVPVRVYQVNNPQRFRIVYALVDDQSSHSLATSQFFDYFLPGSFEYQYILSSCGGKIAMSGRRGHGFVIESLDRTHKLELSNVIECNEIPNNRDEIPFPAVAQKYPHLQEIASLIPTLMDDVEIELLIGRDVVTAHHILDQRLGEGDVPIGQRLPLGWVIVGQVCTTDLHYADVVNVNKTFILPNGRPSVFKPCDSMFHIADNPFIKTENDEKLAFSIEDKSFLRVMETGFKKEEDGHWSAPLPFRPNRPTLPNNKSQAMKRARSFDCSLQRDPLKRQHVLEFMDKIFTSGHAEKAPVIPPDQECWYLPMFGVYHPKKPNSIRVVFDSSACHCGLSLNNVLLKGPDLSNSLQGILLRFRQNAIAITADIEQMFHNFRVDEPDRNYLRFIWHQDNDFKKPLDEFRMRVHVFGNSPSPTVATYGLHRSVTDCEPDVQNFVFNNFYVDDGLISCETEEQAVSLMKRTQKALMEGGMLRLHKIASNSKSVLNQFNQNDLAKDLKSLDFSSDVMPVQRTLGIVWDIETDQINFRVSRDKKPYTRRGVLSTINSLFDPLGLVSPVTLQGKLLLREMMLPAGSTDWDDPLPESFREKWENWTKSLLHLETVSIPRMYGRLSVTQASSVQIHIFCDASKDAIAAVAYMKTLNERSSDVGFLFGKAKVAPSHGHTIPRLELCAAVVAVELAELAKAELSLKKEDFHFYSDSRVVLGYIAAETRRFHVYVANRVGRIRTFSGPEQWNYVPTEDNPADIATRNFNTSDISDSIWLRGPDLLQGAKYDSAYEHFPLIDAERDQEIRKEIVTVKTALKPVLGSLRFSRFSTWRSLVRALITLKTFIRKRNNLPIAEEPSLLASTEKFIIKEVQSEMYSTEIKAIRGGNEPPKNSSLLPLNPILDGNGLLRVGGRTQRRQTTSDSDHYSAQPIIIPKGHHAAVLLIRHHHHMVHHQGRQMTEGAIRSAGYWIVNGKRMITSEIHHCVTCRKLRGKFGWVQMAELPKDRLEEAPPFSYVGLDVFGPWSVVTRRTRGGAANSKRWGVLFTCLVSRGIHVELVEEVSAASFINCLRRFIALRGPVQQIRSDRGTNFVGAVKELNINAQFVENGPVKTYLTNAKITWVFNPPHASHFGGVWERMIGSVRRILDALLLESRSLDLTHEVLSTLMAEVCAIVNSRPLVPVSSDPEAPDVLSPSLLFTQKRPDATYEVPIFGSKEALRSQWKLVQYLADHFWSRWRTEYLDTLQKRTKWHSEGEVFKKGDVVLVKNEDSHRNQWPLGVVEEVFQSEDSRVRKTRVAVSRNGSRSSYVRPICQLVKLLEVA
ncbi:uncharacterized protein LOC111113788 [Crassostrea virginica]